MKKFDFIFIVLVFLFLLFPTIDVFALNVTDYKFDVIFDNGKVFQTGGISVQRNFPDVIRTTVFNNAIKIDKGHKYRLYMTYEYTSNHGYIAIDQDRLFVGNYSWNEWNLGTSYYYNLDQQHDMGNGTYLLEYGQVVEFTSNFTSNGISQDFYYNDKPNFTSFTIKRFDLECLDCNYDGGSTGSNQDIIDNQNKNTQNVIINQDKNTQDIIDNNNKNFDEVNKNLTDDNVDNDNVKNFIDDLQLDESNSPVSDLAIMPLTLLNAYVSGFNSSCSPFSLGSLYGSELSLPCINLQSYLGSDLFSIIDGLFCIFMIYNIAMLCISIFESITSFDDSLNALYTPQHADTGYKPKHGKD